MSRDIGIRRDIGADVRQCHASVATSDDIGHPRRGIVADVAGFWKSDFLREKGFENRGATPATSAASNLILARHRHHVWEFGRSIREKKIAMKRYRTCIDGRDIGAMSAMATNVRRCP
jgi:hypothetical protein